MGGDVEVLSESKKGALISPLSGDPAAFLSVAFKTCKVARELRKEKKKKHRLVSYSSVGNFFDVAQVIVMP